MLLALALAAFSHASVSAPSVEPSSLAPILAGGDDLKSPAYPDLNLKLDLSKFDALAVAKDSATKTCKGEWSGKLGSSDVHIYFNVLDGSKYEMSEPEDVVEIWRDAMTDLDAQDGEAQKLVFTFEGMRCVSGAYGAAPLLATTRALVQRKEKLDDKSSRYLIGGILIDKGWTLRVDVSPPLEKDQEAAFQTFLDHCAHYDGKPREPKWTDAEAQAFWQKLAPEATHKKYDKPIRTEHFLILCDFPGASSFAKKLEADYAATKKALGFEEQKGRKLLPVLLFKTVDEFQLFFTQKAKLDPKQQIDDTGECDANWYATSFDNDDEWDIFTDVAKQLMINRGRCWGCCSWFRSGLRGYIGSKPPDRAEARGAVKRGKSTPLEKLIDDSAWGEKRRRKTNKGVVYEIDYWDQSTLWMEFLRESPLTKDKFPQLVQTLGVMPTGNTDKIVAALESVLGMSVTTLQARYTEYFSKK